MNARSVAKKGAIDQLHGFAAVNELDVICIAETWLTQDVTDAELSKNGMYVCGMYVCGMCMFLGGTEADAAVAL